MFLIEQYIIFTCFAVALFLNLWAEARDNDVLRYYTKPLLIPMIAAFYLIMARETDWFIVAALAFAFIGDVLLLFNYNNTCFRLGAIAFLLGHVCFIHSMLFSIPFEALSPHDFTIPLIPALVPAVIAYAIMVKMFGKFKWLAAVYMLAGTGVLYCALLRFGFFPDYKVWLAIGGALFFVISDFIIAWTRFKKDFRFSGVYIMLTYVIAEIGIVLGLMSKAM